MNNAFETIFPHVQAPVGSVEREIYEEGVRFACWGMAMYSLSCSCYSFVIERLVKRFKYGREKIIFISIIKRETFQLCQTGRDKFTWAVN